MSSSIELTEFQLSLAVFLGVVVVRWLLGLYQKKEPLAFFRFYCLQLAAKVNKPQNSNNQQSIAGIIAVLITLVPLLVILWLFHAFVDVLWLWQGMLLYFSLGALNLGLQNKKIAIDIVAGNKGSAKDKLAPLVLRDTAKLSELGLVKSAIEVQLLKKHQQLICVGAVFFTVGPLAAFAYRLLLEMHYCWNPKIERYQYFGRGLNICINFIQWLPARLLAFVLFIFTLGKKQPSIKPWFRLFFQLNNDILILGLAYLLDCRLGGVVMYQGEKLRREEHNTQARQAKANDILRSRYWLNCALIILTAPLMLIAIMPFLLNIL